MARLFSALLLIVLPALSWAQDLEISGKIGFQARRDGTGQVYTMNSDGSSQARLAVSAFYAAAPSWSPDGTKIALVDAVNGGIYLMNADGTGQINLTTTPDYAVTWSPDGTKLALYSERDGNGEIYVMNPDGTGVIRLTNNPAFDAYVSWSPDGAKIAFTSGRDGGDHEIYVMNADGTAQTRVTTAPGIDYQPAWSPDGTKILFTSRRNSGQDDLYVINPDGTGETRLTSNSLVEMSPAWSADGTKIVYTVDQGSNYEVYIMNADGSGQTRLTNDAAHDIVGNGGWGEAFRRIGAASVGSSTSRTLTIKNRGDATLNVTNITSSDGQFTASPTSFSLAPGSSQNVTVTFTPTSAGVKYSTLTITSNDLDAPTAKLMVNGTATLGPDLEISGKIAFNSGRDGQYEIYTMNTDGTGQTRLTNNSAADIGPGWSPDGAKVVFDTDRDGNYELYAMNADGTGQSNLTNNAGYDEGRSWSPDGTKIAFMSGRDGNNEIYVMNADGTGQTRLTNNGANDNSPSWSPDGSKIAFYSNRDGSVEIYLMNPDGTNQTRLTTTGDKFGPSWSPDGSKIAYFANSEVQVYVMNADGTNQTRLTTARGTNPQWSPDGSKITFYSDRDGNAEVYVMNADGSNQTRLTNNGALDAVPFWELFQRIGSTTVGTPLSRAMTIKNRGDATLSVTNITSSDGQFTLSPTSFSLAPSSSQSVTVTFTPTSAGVKYSTLTITSNDATSPTAKLMVNGTAIQPPPTLSGVFPTRNDADAARNANVTATFSQTMNAGTASTFVVHGSATGRLSGTYGGGSATLSFDPGADFKPGETVEVSLTSGIQSAGGAAISPQVWKFTAAAGTGPAQFTAISRNIGPGNDLTYDMALGDVDADGDLDLAVGNGGGSGPAQSMVYLNDGSGNFTAGTRNFGAASDQTGAVAFGDVDRDGDLDLAVGKYNQQDAVYLNDGSGNFTAGTRNFGTGSDATTSVAFGDVDKDGDLDLAAGKNSQQNAVYLNDGSGNFTAGTRNFGTGSDNTQLVALGDVDGDGDLDVAVGNYNWPGGQQSAVYLNDGSGNFTAGARNFGGSHNTICVALGDVDGDGDLDVATGNDAAQNAVYLNDGSGNFTAGTRNFGTGSDVTQTVAFGDVDGDGDLDIAVGNYDAQQDVVYLNDGSGNFTAGTRNFGTGSDQTIPVVLGDVDGDTDLDIVVGTNGYQNAVYLNQTATPQISVSASSVAAGTVNVGSSGTATFTVGNTGSGALSVTGITVGGTDASQFTVSPSSFTVNAGAAAQTVTVTFAPTSSGSKSASLSIAHNAIGSPSTVSLSGTGAVPDLQIAGKILFHSNRDGNYEIYTMNSDGTNVTRLTNNATDDLFPSWSPDGTKITFDARRDGNPEVYVMNADGSNQTRLTNNSATDTGPLWSPDGTRIAFKSERDGNSEIYVMNADGSNQTRLTNNPALEVYNAWSPDGTKIAFRTDRDGNTEIYVMNADGSNQTRLTNNGASDTYPSWSPDGTKIAFNTSRDGNHEVYVMNADGSSQTRLTNNGANDNSPSWSPDGTKIAFGSNRDDAQGEVYVMNADGSNQTRLTSNPATDLNDYWGEVARLIGSASAGASVSRVLTIENKGGAILNVTSITSSDGQFSVSPTSFNVAAGSSQNVTVTFTPTATGVKYSTLTITSNDADVPTARLTVNGTRVNTAPTITDIANQTINEDAATSALSFTVGDVETAAASLTVSGSSSNPTLVPVTSLVFGGSGASRTVTVNPAANQSGSATITVTVADGGGLSASDSFVLTVNPVNDAPTLAAIPNPAAINEDAGAQTVNLSGIGAGGGETQTLVVTATSSNPALIPNPTVSYTSPNATGSLSYTPVANASGSATITVTVTDDGGTANGGVNAISQSFTLTVNAVNDAPTITDIAPQALNEDAGPQTLTLTAGPGGGSDEAGQTVTLTASSNNTALIPNPTISGTTLSYTPAANQSGNATITVTANDGQSANNITSKSFTVTVNPVNDAPTITDIANQTVNEDAATSALAFTVGDAETAAASLTVTASSSNPTLVPAANIVFGGSGASRTVTITPAANQSGSTTLTVIVSDGTLTASDTFTLTVNSVNDIPTLAAISNPAPINEDAGLQTITLSGIGAGGGETQTLSLTATSSNPALIPNPTVSYTSPNTSGSLSYTPVANASGSGTITVTVNDDGGTANGGINTISQIFTVMVTAVNDAPTITDIANQTINEDAATSALAFTVGDVETATASLTVAASSDNPTLVPANNLALGGSGASRTLVVTPAVNQFGSAIITVTVADGTLSTSDTFTLTVTAINDAPTISDLANVSTKNNTPTGAIEFTVGDAETAAGNLTVTASSGNTALVPVANIVFGGSGVNRTVTITPAAGRSGSATITITVSDGTLTASDPFVLTVSDNTPPTISDIPDQTISEDGATSALAFTVGDVETAAASLTVSSASSNTVLVPLANIALGGSGASRTVRATPAANQSGTATISLTVSDGSATTSKSFLLTVAEVNDAPTLSDITNQNVNEDTPTGTLAFRIKDLETPAGNLVLSRSSSDTMLVPPANIVFSGADSNRTVVVTPRLNQSGSATLTVTVSDGSLSASDSFTLIVNPINDPPVLLPIGPRSVNEGEVLTFTLSVNDVEGDAFLYALGTPPAGAQLVGATFTWIPTFEQAGTYTVTFTVSDGKGGTASEAVVITVNNATPPVWTPSPLVWNFGEVPAGTWAERTFYLKNPGNVAARLDSLVSSSAVFAVISPSFPRSVAGKDSVGVGVRFSPARGAREVQEGVVRVYSSLGQMTVPVAGRGVWVGFAISAEEIDFGKIKPNTTASRILTVSNPGNLKLEIRSARMSNPVFSVTPDTFTVEGGGTRDLILVFSPTQGKAEQGTLTLSGNADSSKVVRLKGQGGEGPSLVLVPTALPFGKVKVDSARVGLVRLRNGGGDTLKITSLGGLEAPFSVSPTQVPALLGGDSTQVRVRFAPAVRGSFNDTLLIASNADTRLVPVTGQGIRAELRLPERLVFDPVPLGSAGELNMVLTNAGDDTLLVTNILSSKPQRFQVGTTSLVVPPNNAQGVTVRYTPAAAGKDSTDLTLSTNVGVRLVRVVGSSEERDVVIRLVPAEFGSVKVGEKQTARVVAVNRGRSSVTIDSLQISPAGLPMRLASGSLPRTLRPRDSVEVATLEFAPTAAGTFSGTLRVKGRGVEQLITLSGTGTPVTERPPVLSYSPADTLKFGVVSPNQSELKPVEIRNLGSGTLKVVLRSESAEFVPEERDTLRVEANQSHSALIRFKPARTGTRRANLLIWSNDPQKPLSSLVMQGGGGGLYFDPPSVVFGEVKVGVKKDTTVLLVNQTASALMVRLSLPAEDFSVDRLSARIDAGKSLVLKISFRPSRAGQKAAKLAVQGRDLGLELTGTGVEETVTPIGGIQVSANPLTMDNTQVRATSRKSLIVSNTGTQSVSVTLTLSGPNANQFRVAPSRQTLTPGQRRNVVVSFVPTSTGAKRATLTIAPSTGNPLTVALSGTALAAAARGLSAPPDQGGAPQEAAKPAGSGDLVLALGNNYPNPFNAQTTIGYQLPERAGVRLEVYDLMGQKVRTLVDQVQEGGYYQVVWDGRDRAGNAVASGVYFYRLEAGSFHAVRKMLLLR